MRRITKNSQAVLSFRRCPSSLFFLLFPFFLFSGCVVVPTRNTVTVDQVIRSDEPAMEGARVRVQMEWVR